MNIIFTHYGDCDYLSRTLECAAITNGAARRILIGDRDNKAVAERFGWEHVHMDGLASDLRAGFGRVFRPVQGKRHTAVKNGRDWLKFMFERWFIVEAFCREEGLGSFWHFDSDVMILEDLEQFAGAIAESGVDYTRQCNDTCLNGFVTSKILREYGLFTIALFMDEEFLRGQQREFDTVNPGCAFTEMSAFSLFMKATKYRGRHLECLAPGWWFDDALCQDDGFEMTTLGKYGRPIKWIRFDGAKFYALKVGEPLRFAAANCSWLNVGVLDWFLERVKLRPSVEGGPERHLGEIDLGIGHTIRNYQKEIGQRLARLVRG